MIRFPKPRHLPRHLIAAAAMALAPAGATADNSAPLGQVGLQKRIDALAADASANAYEIGMLQVLRGVEKSLQTRTRYGLGNRIINMPLLRLGGRTGRPSMGAQQAAPDTLSKMFVTFMGDMDTARATLKSAEKAGAKPFVLDLQDIWLDANENGLRDPGESAMQLLAPMVLDRRTLRTQQKDGGLNAPVPVRFDAADLNWMVAYTHMLSGVGDLYLAFDPTTVLADLAKRRAALANVPTIPNPYDQATVMADIKRIQADLDAFRARDKVLNEQYRSVRTQINQLRTQSRTENDVEKRQLLDSQIKQLRAEQIKISQERNGRWRQRRALRNELRAAQSKLSSNPRSRLADAQPTVDLIYVILKALEQKPDAARIKSAHTHWLAMIDENKRFWAKLEKETDNDREWIPNPSQTGAMQITVSAEMARGWQNVLADAESVLKGELLIPHPMLPHGTGINLKSYVENPGPMDLISWIQGIGGYDYVNRGPRITAQSWAAFTRMTRGNSGGFALFFN